jgi:hypothetical protein
MKNPFRRPTEPQATPDWLLGIANALEPKEPATRPIDESNWAQGMRAYQEYADKHGEAAAGRIMDEMTAEANPGYYTEQPPWRRAQEADPDPETHTRSIDPA